MNTSTKTPSRYEHRPHYAVGGRAHTRTREDDDIMWTDSSWADTICEIILEYMKPIRPKNIDAVCRPDKQHYHIYIASMISKNYFKILSDPIEITGDGIVFGGNILGPDGFHAYPKIWKNGDISDPNYDIGKVLEPVFRWIDGFR
jgi:hypothetical protein